VRAKTWRLAKPLRKQILGRHPWIYDRALAPASGMKAGDVVTIVDEAGPLATAIADPESPIRARVLELDTGRPIDGAWVRDRAGAAARRRAADPLLAGCTGVRVIHGEGDGCPGLVIDRYDTTAVVVFDGPAASAFWRPRLPDVIAALDEVSPLAHVWLRGERGQRPRVTDGEAWRGDPPQLVAIAEDAARFHVDVRHGQKTGFFLDQRDNRRLIARHAAGARVLNVFSYTGGFSIHAALGGAAQVTSVDIAAPAIAALEANLALSGVDPARHESAAMDAFDFFTRAAKKQRTWDLVIVDPPSFAPSERTRPAALAAYGKLAAAALEVVAPGGRFALASCSSHVTEADLLAVAADLPATLRLRCAAGAGSDHPVLPAFPEGRYLKFLFFDVG
jgi:23S rRNA (cytosine1962-C5)-methyltransferase